MRPINLIVVHCSATRPDMDVDAAEIRRWHKAQGWTDIGYHFVIKRDGAIEVGRPLKTAGAHAVNHNANSIGVCLVGGLDAKGKASATFLREQYETLEALLNELRAEFPNTAILGHRDLPKVAKECPSFNVRTWCTSRGIDPGTYEPK